MHVVSAKNVNTALPHGVRLVRDHGVNYPSRNGEMIEATGIVVTVYECPWERVLVDPIRDANPFFHLIESLWMLDGRNDVATLTKFNAGMANFSDDGKTFNGCYGYRWRHWFGRDQLEQCVSILKSNPVDRRVVLQHWDGSKDLGSSSKDVPCNTAVYFKLREGVLDMTVTNRSNDVIWGAYGANAVHFSVLQEYVAARLNAHIGKYFQVSNSFHVYTWNELWQPLLNQENLRQGSPDDDDPYASHTPGIEGGYFDVNYFDAGLTPYPLFDRDQDPEAWNRDLRKFMFAVELGHDFDITFTHSFFPKVAAPMVEAYRWFKTKVDNRFDLALEVLDACEAEDWKEACRSWLIRRRNKAKAAG